MTASGCGSTSPSSGADDRAGTAAGQTEAGPPPTSPDPTTARRIQPETTAGNGGSGAASIPTLASGATASTATTAPPPPTPDERPLPTSADDLAAELTEVELALRAPGIDQESAAPWGRRQQALYRVLSLNPEWVETVLDAVEASVADAVALNWSAREDLLALVHTEELSETLPAWRIEPPRPADELLGYYREAESATGVPWEILAAINLIETRMGRIEGVSTAGAVGPMQFLPTTWAECCEGDPTDPRTAINGAGRYLVQRGADRDLDRAIFGYNNSNYYVAAVTAYAAVMEADPETYYGYHAWQVYFLSAAGLAVIPEGYEEAEPVDAAEWLAAHPEHRFPT